MAGSMMRLFRKDENGFILVLALIVMPIFIGFGLLIIDMGRGNNAHADLYAAADSVALAGARELDGGPDAIGRAKTAMANVTNSVSMLSRIEPGERVQLIYADEAGNEFQVVFLSNIPELDTTPITTAFLTANETTDDALAEYVYVRVQSNDMESAFLNPASLLRETVPIAAVAVAKALPDVVCDVTPLFICNPFENDPTYSNIGDAFNAGELHGRLIRLHPQGSDTASPGNFGFLQVAGANDNTTASADKVREAFAGGAKQCYEQNTVSTKPGAAVSIANGLNVRFDIFNGNFSTKNKVLSYPPAQNVRKGYILDPSPGNKPIDYCAGRKVETDEMSWAMPLPDNIGMDEFGQVSGAAFGTTEVWNLEEYWDTNHPTTTLPIIPSSFPTLMPSRYDVYRYEIEQGEDLSGGTGDLSQGDNDTIAAESTVESRESGLPQCYMDNNDGLPPVTEVDRRLIFAAIIDCEENLGSGSNNSGVPVEAFANIFLVNPMESGGAGTIDVEIIDVTGSGENGGTLDDFVRSEAVLVR